MKPKFSFSHLPLPVSALLPDEDPFQELQLSGGVARPVLPHVFKQTVLQHKGVVATAKITDLREKRKISENRLVRMGHRLLEEEQRTSFSMESRPSPSLSVSPSFCSLRSSSLLLYGLSTSRWISLSFRGRSFTSCVLWLLESEADFCCLDLENLLPVKVSWVWQRLNGLALAVSSEPDACMVAFLPAREQGTFKNCHVERTSKHFLSPWFKKQMHKHSLEQKLASSLGNNPRGAKRGTFLPPSWQIQQNRTGCYRSSLKHLKETGRTIKIYGKTTLAVTVLLVSTGCRSNSSATPAFFKVASAQNRFCTYPGHAHAPRPW